MRYLSKIIFINSADKSVRYAEVELDGNVHFIGTQGVGKSTLLRAILFFYNANIQKLGIPREKKNYNDYYFPFQNSYIVYEVQTDTGPFCVLSFKSQGRTAFRFFNAAYEKSYFIDHEGRAYESWGKIRDALGAEVRYTRMVNSYEEYRNILYGNNQGLHSQFRKYALLESRQYQNIPRTIANVFLNAKLDAEFVKETIIKSLNDEEVKIDLTTYSQTHLRDFETNLNDLRKWTEKNHKGENPVEKQAEKTVATYSALRFLEQKLTELAAQIGFALSKVKERLPVAEATLLIAEERRNKVKDKLREQTSAFEKEKAKIQEQIGEYAGKLREIKQKREYYRSLDIQEIIKRVGEKKVLELEAANLAKEKEILTSKFLEIEQRYEAQVNQLENRLSAFKNRKETEKNTAKAHFLEAKDNWNERYGDIFEHIKKQYEEDILTAQSRVTEKDNSINQNRISRSEIRHTRYFETEIDHCKSEKLKLLADNDRFGNQISGAGDKIKTLQKEWALEEGNIKERAQREILLEKESIEQLMLRKEKITAKIENSKDSFYGWLNQHVPGWETTIGKVIDEERVLFLPGLNPKKVADTPGSFYGLDIDLQEVSKKVTTVADLTRKQEDFDRQITTAQQKETAIQLRLEEDVEKLRRRMQPKIKEQKERLKKAEYQKENGKIKMEALKVREKEWVDKAAAEQATKLAEVDRRIGQLNEEKVEVAEQLKKLEKRMAADLRKQQKEKEDKIAQEEGLLNDRYRRIADEVTKESDRISKQLAETKASQRRELKDKGADITRIDQIDLRVADVQGALNFIENNRDKVAEYNKDKRELFDREEEFKNNKKLLHKQLAATAEKHQQRVHKFRQQASLHEEEIAALNKTLNSYRDDLSAFEAFNKTAVYQETEKFFLTFSEKDATERNCAELINEINTTNNTITSRLFELQEAINKFTGNFQENNLFKFRVKFEGRKDYFEFAAMLGEFMEEQKIDAFKKRFEERFAHIIRQIGHETNTLISKEGEISQVIREINNDFIARNFVGAIKRMELKTDKSANRIFQLLVEIKDFNDENLFELGRNDLFSSSDSTKKNEKAISLLKQLIKEMAASKEKEITLSDSFELLFKIVENGNDTGWVERLTNVGSEGTDVLAKAMINIMLLNVFKEKASRKNKGDFRLHCMMDEIGKLHPTNVKGILKFANDRNILLINSSPTTFNATDYRYTYLLSRDQHNITSVKRLIRKISTGKAASELLSP